MTIKNLLTRLGDTQSKMILATFENNPELVEHYRAESIKISKQLSHLAIEEAYAEKNDH